MGIDCPGRPFYSHARVNASGRTGRTDSGELLLSRRSTWLGDRLKPTQSRLPYLRRHAVDEVRRRQLPLGGTLSNGREGLLQVPPPSERATWNASRIRQPPRSRECQS